MSAPGGHPEPGPATALVLCGGRSTRFGSGDDKTAAPLGVGSVLGHLLAGLPPAWDVVAVGLPRPVDRHVVWAREEPPGGGPLAGIAAGMRQVTTTIVVVLAGDMPFAGAWAARLAATLAVEPSLEAVAAVVGDGPPNPLFAAYRSDVVRRCLPADPGGQAARRLLDRRALATLQVPAEDGLDVDTPEAHGWALELALERPPHRLGP